MALQQEGDGIHLFNYVTVRYIKINYFKKYRKATGFLLEHVTNKRHIVYN